MSIPKPLDCTIESEKIDAPMEMMKIVQRYTTWEDFEIARKKSYYEMCSAGTSVEDLEKELEIMEKLYSDLKDYDRDCRKSLHDAVEIAKQQIFDKFPGIQNIEEYNELDDEDWVEAILEFIYRTVNATIDYDDNCNCGCVCRRDWSRFSLATVAYDRTPYRSHSRLVKETDNDVEIRLTELYEELRTNRSKVLEAKNLCMTSSTVCWSVDSLISNLNKVVAEGRNKKTMDDFFRAQELEDERMRKEWKETEEEDRKLTKEKFRCLCTLMKEVLDDRVEDVVVSFEGYSSCYLKDSETGGKLMVIYPHNTVIMDLQKRSDTDKSDTHVRNATLVLFYHAELFYNTLKEQNSLDVFRVDI